MKQLICEYGEDYATVARVVERAGVSRQAFYEHFDDRNDCLSAVFDEFVAVAARRALTASTRGRGWLERVRAGMLALLELLDEEPVLARMCVADAVPGGLSRHTARGATLAKLVTVLEHGREETAARDRPAPCAARSVIGGTLGMIHARLLGPERSSLVELLNPLMAMLVLPYLGEAAALRELARPNARPCAATKRAIAVDACGERDGQEPGRGRSPRGAEQFRED
jgi:AcrR family transcriptional regulator